MPDPVDEITQAAIKFADRTATFGRRPQMVKAYLAGYTAGLERAAKEADDEGCGRPECRECVGQRVASKIRTLAHPPKEEGPGD